MLHKNVYLIYPPGYSGSYLSWCLSKSEKDLSTITVDDPLNISDNKKFGGSGTSHLHYRIPTHATIREIIYWLILNQPKEKKIFLVNGWDRGSIITSIDSIMNMDRDPVIIHITADNHYDRCVGNLNAMTKWPLYFHAKKFNETYNIDFFNTKNDLKTRDTLVKHYNDIFPMSFNINKPPNDGFTLNTLRDNYQYWFTIRNEHNPHEVNGLQFIEPYNKPKYFYSIDLMTIYGNNIFNVLESITQESELGEFDFSFVKNYHPAYVVAQTNLKFKNQIINFRHTKKLNDYLLSHPLLQALTVMEMLVDTEGIEWKSKTLQEIVKVYNTIKGP